MKQLGTYLDNAASEPIRPEVRDSYLDTWQRLGGMGANPSASHAAGRAAAALLEDARERVARVLGAEPIEVVFTGGGTQADNIAIRGLGHGVDGPAVISALEHPAVAVTAAQVGEVAVLPLTATGDLDRQAAQRIIGRRRPRLVSVLAVGNETGVVMPVPQVVQWVREAWGTDVPVHTDAVQAAGRMRVDFAGWGVDTMAIAGHKLGAVSNVGALVVRRGVNIYPSSTGGGQERQIRPGTQDVAAARGLACALELAASDDQHRGHQRLAEQLQRGVAGMDGVRLIRPRNKVPGIMMFVCAGCTAEPLLLALDRAGVYAAAGSACHTGVSRPSLALLAQGIDEDEAAGSLRVSFGWATTAADVQRLIDALPEALALARRFGRRR